MEKITPAVDNSIDSQVIPSNFKNQSFRNIVKQHIQSYFEKIEDDFVIDVYDMILTEIEVALLEVMMDYTNNNQSKVATLLGLSRGTVRSRLKAYGFLPQKRNKIKRKK